MLPCVGLPLVMNVMCSAAFPLVSSRIMISHNDFIPYSAEGAMWGMKCQTFSPVFWCFKFTIIVSKIITEVVFGSILWNNSIIIGDGLDCFLVSFKIHFVHPHFYVVLSRLCIVWPCKYCTECSKSERAVANHAEASTPGFQSCENAHKKLTNKDQKKLYPNHVFSYFV